jgi:glucan phosphoethanolaminetransferase (alkaline phosphatase superfamily)
VDRVKNLAVAKLLYALLFVGLLPLLLVIWAANTRGVVALRPVHSLSWGLVTAGVGLVLMALGTASLWRLGGGLVAVCR